MWPLELGWAIAGIHLLAALVLATHVMAAIAELSTRRDLDEARARVAQGVVAALSVMVAGTVLRTLDVREWNPIAMLAVLMAMRILMKRHFGRHVRESSHVAASSRLKR